MEWRGRGGSLMTSYIQAIRRRAATGDGPLDPNSLSVLSALTTTRGQEAMACHPTLKAVFITTSSSTEGCRAVNVADPYAMVEAGFIANSAGGHPYKIAINVTRDIVIAGVADTFIYDISDINALALLDSDGESNGGGVALTSDGNYLLRCLGDLGIRIVDVSADTYGTEYTANHSLGGFTYQTDVVFNSDNTYCYVADWNADRLEIYNVTTKTSPSYSGLFTDAANMNSPYCLIVSGDWLFVACSAGNSITVLDISTPSTPVYNNKLVDATDLNGAKEMVLIDGVLYVIATDRITAVDVSDPTAPSVISSLVDATNLPAPNCICTDGRYLFVGNNASNKVTCIG